MKKLIVFIAVILLFLTSSLSVKASDERLSIAVLPFNNLQMQSLDMHISDVLRSDLQQYKFIETVPVDVVRQKLFDIEPSLMWTGEEGGYREGGIIWKIDTKIIESVHYNGFADYYIFGDYSGLSKKWSIIAHISKNALSEPDETFILKGSSEDDLYKKLSELAEKINKKLSKVYVLNQAEDIVRDYMGNLFNYDAAVEKMSSIVKKNPDLIQLHALLLDLYLKEKNNMDKAAHEALRIIDMYDPSHENEVRYILSLSLDPFDVIAREYEAEKKWTETIEVRNRALMIFPANMSVHKNKLGEAYYFEALSYETMGSKEKANINYNNALKYLNPSSEYYGPAAKGFSEGGQP